MGKVEKGRSGRMFKGLERCCAAFSLLRLDPRCGFWEMNGGLCSFVG